MYGLLLDAIQKFLCERYGERYWTMVRRRAKLENQWFVTHEIYEDSIMYDLVDAASIELGEEKGTVMRMFGEYFAENIGRYGYARLLRVLGRDLTNFLNGLDDLHEYLRFSYPKMDAPSFFCEKESEKGLILHYTTKRRGFLQYVIGQLNTVGRIYGKDLEVTLLSEETSETGATHMIMDLKFDNSEWLRTRHPSREERKFTIHSDIFLGIFPFCVFFDKDLVVWRVGVKLQEVLPDVMGMSLKDCFTIRKPMFETLNFEAICFHANSVFELISVSLVVRKQAQEEDVMYYKGPPPSLRLKGQMMHLQDMETLAFLCSPVMDSPEDLYESGMYVNDLAMHDSTRDMVLSGSKKHPELNLALNQEKIRSAQLEESIHQTDQLLFQMIPKPIADQLRNGETPLNTCKEFSSVSILFSDIVSFTSMCSRLHAMEVVCVLNAMYVAYDQLCELNHVYKVETIGDAYMALCGAPLYTVHHAEYMCDFAMAIIKATYKINDPSTGDSLKIRVGIHSGNVVAGVVGSNVLRYDVFGDTVNVAARMEATGSPMRVHVSEATAELLSGSKYATHERGYVEAKGKGLMRTFWIEEKDKIALLKDEVPLAVSSLPALPTVSIYTPPPASHSSLPLLPSIVATPNVATPAPVPPPSPPASHSTLLLLPSNEATPAHIPPPSSPLPPLRSAVTTPTPLPMSHPLFPKPNEWPEATQQLQKFTTVALDRSVPPRGDSKGVRYSIPFIRHVPSVGGARNSAPSMGGARNSVPSVGGARNSVPSVGGATSTQLSHDSIPSILNASPPTSTSDSTSSLSLSDMNETLWTHQQLIQWRSEQPLIQQCPVPRLMPSSLVADIENPSVHSDTNMLQFPGNLPSQSNALVELEGFALQAEANAKQARELADWASEIVCAFKEGRDDTHDAFEGTSSSTNTTPNHCPVGQHEDHINGCPLDEDDDGYNGLTCTIM